MSQEELQSPEHLFVSAMKEMRTARGWSQERLAREVGERAGYRLNPTAITKLEWLLDPARATGARALRVNEANAIAQAFRSDLSLMLSDDRAASRPQEALLQLSMQLEGARHALAVLDQQRFLTAQQVQAIERQVQALTEMGGGEHEDVRQAVDGVLGGLSAEPRFAPAIASEGGEDGERQEEA